jgi:hypothetical protein
MPDAIIHLQVKHHHIACAPNGDGDWIPKTRTKEDITCLQCKLTNAYLNLPPAKTAGQPAVVMEVRLTHLRRPKGLRAFCDTPEGERRAYGIITTEQGAVTCPDCLNIMSREAEKNMPITSDTPEAPFEERPIPLQEEITEAHRHDWDMAEGPHWPHDCEGCTYLGTRWMSVQWDLYHCGQGRRPTVIARRGEGGDYISGIEFIDREPMLALAYVRAVQAGIHQGPAS